MSIELIIDQRERELKAHFTNIENVKFENLDIGDIIFRKNSENILIIERKRVDDLAASICDGRNREQKARLLGSDISRDRILYLIEGDLNRELYTKIGSVTIDTLLGSIINTQFRDGLKIYKTTCMKETIIFIEKLWSKLNRDENTFWQYDGEKHQITAAEYSSTIKTKKKDNMTADVWFNSQLCLIPQISTKISAIIVAKYTTVINLVKAYDELPIEKRKDMLTELTYRIANDKMRKIGPKISEKVYNFFYGN
jgi:crossover junction endonuclease MUS81